MVILLKLSLLHMNITFINRCLQQNYVIPETSIEVLNYGDNTGKC